MKRYFLSLLLFCPLVMQAQELRLTAPDTTEQVQTVAPSKPAATLRSHLQDNVREHRILLKSAVVMAGAGGIGALTFAYADEPVRDFTLAHRNHVTNTIAQYVEPLGRSGNMLPASGAVYAAGLALRNPKLQRAGILAASSVLVNDFASSKLKKEFQRHRPDVTDENHIFDGPEGGRRNLSLPSSHTSTAFAFATSFATVYKDHKWVPPVAYGMATLVGLSRINDNKHWATDVLAGAAVGYLSTKATYFVLRQLENRLARKRINIYLAPRLQQGNAGFSAGYTF